MTAYLILSKLHLKTNIKCISLAARDQTAALAVRIAELKLDHDEVEPEAAADYRLEDTTARPDGH